MMHETAALDRAALVQGLLKRVEHEAGVRRPAHPPADDATSISIDHKGNIDEAGPGRDVGEIGDPEHVRLIHSAPHPVRGSGALRGFECPSEGPVKLVASGLLLN